MFIDDTKLIQANNGADLAIDVVTLSQAVGDLVLQGPSGIVSVPSVIHAAGGLVITVLLLTNLPTSSDGLATGTVWNNGGVLCVA